MSRRRDFWSDPDGAITGDRASLRDKIHDGGGPQNETDSSSSSAESEELNQINPEQVTVAIFCALAYEMAAVQYTLDDEYACRGKISGPRKYAYSFGRLGDHIAVIVMSTEVGLVRAAHCAATVSQQFVNVRFALMVGVGGGIPRPPHQDIRLGDVAVSTPMNGLPGVLQYDLGRYEVDQKFELKACLNKPPTCLLSADNSLNVAAIMKHSPLRKILKRIITRNPIFRRPETPDVLFDDTFPHSQVGEDCNACMATGCESMIHRKARKSSQPVVHRGLILSGGGVVKNAEDRRKLQRGQPNAICYEMEAAGIVDEIPCLVIRGICDYADTHKQDNWHWYASAVAAAYAKAILLQVEGSDIEVSSTMNAILKVGYNLDELSTRMRTLEAAADGDDKGKILEWLDATNYGLQQSDLFDRQYPGTGQWFLEAAEVKKWLMGNGLTLFCPGVPGAGKSVLAAILVDHLVRNVVRYPEAIVTYIFCNYKRRGEQTLTHFLSNLIKQIFQQQPLEKRIAKVVVDLYSSYERHGTRPSHEQLQNALKIVLCEIRKVYIVIDALDECECREELLRVIFELREKAVINIVVTSRYDVDLVRRFDVGSLRLDISANIDDLKVFASNRLSRTLNGILSSELRALAMSRILQATDGMFLLVEMRTDTIMQQISPGRVRSALRTLSEDFSSLDHTYRLNMARIEDQAGTRRDLAMQALAWIINAKRPLLISELRHALADPPDAKTGESDYMPSEDIILDVCKGLVSVDMKSRTFRLIHHTTQEFLEREHFNRLGNTHKDITRKCVTALSLDRLAKAAGSPWKAAMSICDYAAEHWGNHARHLKRQPPEVIELLRDTARVTATYKLMRQDWDSPIQKLTGAHLVAFFNFRELQLSFLDSLDIDRPNSQGQTPLFFAAKEGNLSLAQYLIKRGANVNHICQDALTPICYAMERRNLDVEQLLLQSGASIDLVTHGKSTLLMTALESCKENLAVAHAIHGASVHVQDDKGRTPLHHAISNGLAAVTQVLLDHGANPEIRDANGMTPFILFASEGALKWKLFNTWLFLKKLGAASENCDSHGRTALSYAAGNQDNGFINCLMNLGARMDSRSFDGRTPLHYAVCNGRLENARYLLERGAPVDATEKHGRTPLSFVSHRDMATLLIYYGASIESRCNRGRTPLSYAAELGATHAVQDLIRDGACVDSKCELGETPFSYALKGEPNVNVLDVLLRETVGLGSIFGRTDHSKQWKPDVNCHRLSCQAGCEGHPSDSRTIDLGEAMTPSANGSAPDSENIPLDRGTPGETLTQRAYNIPRDGGLLDGQALQIYRALLYSVVNYRPEIARPLLEKTTDVEWRTLTGRTLLSYAAENSGTEIVEMLLERGADIEAECHRGRRPLMYAVASGCFEVVTLLIERGAAIDFRCRDYRKPLCYAAERGDVMIIASLTMVGATLASQPTALSYAIKGGHVDAASILMAEGVPMETLFSDGQIPLFHAVEARAGDIQVAAFLLDQGIDVNFQCGLGRTALMHAAAQGRLEMAQFLLSKGAWLNLRDCRQQTPLHFATERLTSIYHYPWLFPDKPESDDAAPVKPAEDIRSVIYLLLQHGADPDVEDVDGNTPRRVAREAGLDLSSDGTWTAGLCEQAVRLAELRCEMAQGKLSTDSKRFEVPFIDESGYCSDIERPCSDDDDESLWSSSSE